MKILWEVSREDRWKPQNKEMLRPVETCWDMLRHVETCWNCEILYFKQSVTLPIAWLQSHFLFPPCTFRCFQSSSKLLCEWIEGCARHVNFLGWTVGWRRQVIYANIMLSCCFSSNSARFHCLSECFRSYCFTMCWCGWHGGVPWEISSRCWSFLLKPQDAASISWGTSARRGGRFLAGHITVRSSSCLSWEELISSC